MPILVPESDADGTLKVSNIETYYGPILAIRGVSFTIRRGEFVTILGANGAGKSTVLKTISGIVDPQKGSVHFGTHPIHGWDPDAIARLGISLVPEGREVFPLLSVLDNLRMGAYSRRDRREIPADIERVFEYFPSLRRSARRAAFTLSGGEQQMLVIGRALMSRPKMILLDEPSLGLSPLLVTEIFRILQRVNAELGVTLLVVEQNASIALKTAHFAHVLEMGRVVMSGTTAELMEQDDVKEFYLGLKSDGIRGTRRWKKRKTWR
ncbi:MAG: ABC transporter ATP-binding protein [Desulfobacterales bacterium]|nr:ABC transporter ATP-binding protein [Desulfobacterales bacterium]